jgi:hypothetical protein
MLQGTLPSMSTRLLNAWDNNWPIVHTAVDDLESFLWVLVWVLVHILKEFGTTRNWMVDHLVERLSSNIIPFITARDSTVEDNWQDVVFGDLIREWLDISRKAKKAIRQLSGTTFGSGNDMDFQPVAFNRLEEYCRMVYMEYIRVGQKHLESIRRYPNWNAVVEANPGWL